MRNIQQSEFQNICEAEKYFNLYLCYWKLSKQCVGIQDTIMPPPQRSPALSSDTFRLIWDLGFSSLVSILHVHPLWHQSFKNKLENIIENCAKYAFRLEKHCIAKSSAQ